MTQISKCSCPHERLSPWPRPPAHQEEDPEPALPHVLALSCASLKGHQAVPLPAPKRGEMGGGLSGVWCCILKLFQN